MFTRRVYPGGTLLGVTLFNTQRWGKQGDFRGNAGSTVSAQLDDLANRS
jgi:hypothetical protein